MNKINKKVFILHILRYITIFKVDIQLTLNAFLLQLILIYIHITIFFEENQI